MAAALRLAAAIVVALALAGCDQGKKGFNSVDISGASYAHDFRLKDPHGNVRSLVDFRGKVVVVFFGFAQCPDVCPTTLADLAEIKKRLGKDGDQLQVIFITLDPERDTPQVLAPYVAAFDPSFIGLAGTPEETIAVAKEFKIFFQKVPGKTATSYTLDHTAGSFVFDRDGHVRLFVRHAGGVEPVLEDIKALLG
jgi:protein SCO1/2